MSDGEEKSEPASAKKLRDQREKGQVAKAPDLMAAITTGALFGYVLLSGGMLATRAEGLIDDTGRAVSMPFETAEPLMLAASRSVLMSFALPGLLIACVSAVLASLLINKGFIFSVQALMPKLAKLNPIAGLKGLFKASALIDLVKSLVKAVMLGAALLLIARAAVGPLLNVPACSPGCVPVELRSMMVPLLGASALFYLAAGLVDVMLQRWLFLRENRMTKTELKQERKETFGNPHVKGQLRRARREMTQGPRLGVARASILVYGPDIAVGIRYVAGDSPIPTVVCRARGERAAEMTRFARAKPLPIYRDAALAADLYAKVKPGARVTQPFFASVARALKFAG